MSCLHVAGAQNVHLELKAALYGFHTGLRPPHHSLRRDPLCPRLGSRWAASGTAGPCAPGQRENQRTIWTQQNVTVSGGLAARPFSAALGPCYFYESVIKTLRVISEEEVIICMKEACLVKTYWSRGGFYRWFQNVPCKSPKADATI